MTTLLATATLSASYFYANKYGGAGNYYASPQDNVFQTVDGNPICNITGHVGDIIYPLCGTDSLNNSAIGAGTVTNGWVWVGWVICVSWLAFCFFQKMFSSNGSTSHGPALHAASPNQATSGAPKALAKRSLLRTFLFMITSTLCFGGQFYLFTVYLRHSYISYEWSFGQIIAVTVWIPSVVEFFYNSVGKLRALEFPYQGKDERLTWSAGVERAARYRYPSPLRVIRGMALTLADLNPQGTTPAAALRVSNVQTLYDMQ